MTRISNSVRLQNSGFRRARSQPILGRDRLPAVGLRVALPSGVNQPLAA
jgi:hypothetical protein